MSMADKKGAEKSTGPGKYGAWTRYEVQGDKLVRKNKWSPKLGAGFAMANHKGRTTCGGTGYTEFQTKEKSE